MSAETGDNLQLKKRELRKEVRSRIKTMSNDSIVGQSARVWNRLFGLEAYKSAKSIGVFLSMPTGEIKTDAVLADALSKGKKIYIPQVGKNFERSDMELMRVFVNEESNDNSALPFHHEWPRNKWGIPEPPPEMPQEEAKPGDIDLLIVPGLAFDASGARLGQGKGYYDRFIARMKTGVDSPKPLLVAVAMEPQLVDSLPMSEHDIHMDMLLLPDQTMTFTA